MSSAPDSVVTKEALEELIQTYEQPLRASFDENGTFPDEWEQELKKIDRSSAMGALRYFKTISIYQALRYYELEQRQAPQGTVVEAQDAARSLLRREPITLELPDGRVLHVTSRSYSAMMEVAEHALKVKGLQKEIERVQQLREKVLARMIQSEGSQNALRRRHRALGDIHRLLVHEIELHRVCLYANVLSENGAPVESLSDIGESVWELAREIDPALDLLLLRAALEAGPLRLRALGMRAPPDGQKSEAPEAQWWESLLASFGIKAGINPAEPFNKDLAQLVAQAYLAHPPEPEKKDDHPMARAGGSRSRRRR